MTVNPDKIIESLRQEAKRDEALRDVMHMFAGKERSFRQGKMTLSGLSQRMNADGFEHNERAYASVIQKLADAGLGTLEKTPNGAVLGLRHVNIVPKSLGSAVLEGNTPVKPYKRRNKYVKATPEKAAIQEPVEVTLPVSAPADLTVELKVIIKGQPVSVTIPKGMAAQDVATLIAKLSS